MSLVELGLLALQGASLTGLSALLLTEWQRRRQVGRRVPHHFDHELARGPVVPLGVWGRARLEGVDGDQLADGRVALALEVDRLRVYEVWALTGAGWLQLVPDGRDGWRSPLVVGVPVRTLRLWVDLSGDAAPDTRPARQAAPMLLQAPLVLSRRRRELPAPPAAAALSDSGHDPRAWAEACAADVLVAGLLDEWTEACVAASRVGWVLGIPTGDSLLTAWARAAGPVPVAPAEAFACWLVGELGRATRHGIEPGGEGSEPAAEREVLERREPVARGVFAAAGRLVRALDEGLSLDPAAPRAVGPRQQEAWLVDEALASRLGNAPVNGLVQPVVVLRPVLRRGEAVLLEGEVA